MLAVVKGWLDDAARTGAFIYGHRLVNTQHPV